MVKKFLINCILAIVSLVLLSGICSATILVVDDFDSGLFYNNVGAAAGVSNNKGGPGEFCNGKIISNETTGTGNLFLQLIYHINFIQNTDGESKDNFTGYWSKLNDLDVSDYSYFTLYVKGDKKTGRCSFWIELGCAASASRIQVKKITDEWQKFKIPLEEFPDLEDKTKLTELRIIFDQTSSVEDGTVYIDNIAFEQ